MSKEKWEKPELIVLIRGKPEEAVLSACKRLSSGPWGSDTDKTGCLVDICHWECLSRVDS